MKNTRIMPRGKQVLVQPDPEKSRVSDHGLVTPENVEQEKKAVGTVIAVGPEIQDVKKGDRVIYGAFLGEHIKLKEGSEDVDYILLHDDDIIAFLEECN